MIMSHGDSCNGIHDSLIEGRKRYIPISDEMHYGLTGFDPCDGERV